MLYTTQQLNARKNGSHVCSGRVYIIPYSGKYKRTFYHHLDQIYSLGEGTLMGVGSLLF